MYLLFSQWTAAKEVLTNLVILICFPEADECDLAKNVITWGILEAFGK